jgi:hypothetical protein
MDSQTGDPGVPSIWRTYIFTGEDIALYNIAGYWKNILLQEGWGQVVNASDVLKLGGGFTLRTIFRELSSDRGKTIEWRVTNANGISIQSNDSDPYDELNPFNITIGVDPILADLMTNLYNPSYKQVYWVVNDNNTYNPPKRVNGSYEFPYRSFNALLMDHQYETNVQVIIGSYDTNPISITIDAANKCQDWLITSYGSPIIGELTVQTPKITFDGLKFGTIIASADPTISPNNYIRFNNCTFGSPDDLLLTPPTYYFRLINTYVELNNTTSFVPIQIAAGGHLILSDSKIFYGIDINDDNSILIGYNSIYASPSTSSTTEVISSITGIDKVITLYSGKCYKFNPTAGYYTVTAEGRIDTGNATCFFGTTLFDREHSTITNETPNLGLTAEQLFDNDKGRFTIINPTTGTQKDINTAIDAAIKATEGHKYEKHIYIDGNTMEDIATQDGSYDHPYKAMNFGSSNSNIIHVSNIINIAVSSDVSGYVVIGETPGVSFSTLTATNSSGTFRNVKIDNLVLSNSQSTFENCILAINWGSSSITNGGGNLVRFINCTNIADSIALTDSDGGKPLLEFVNCQFEEGSFLNIPGSYGVTFVDCENVTIQSTVNSDGYVKVLGNTSLTPSSTLASPFALSATGSGSVFVDVNNAGIYNPLPILNIGSGAKYCLGRILYDKENSVIDSGAIETLSYLQANQVKDTQTWEMIQPGTPKQSDINKAIDATLKMITNMGGNRGEVLSAYVGQQTWVVTNVSVATGSVYTTSAVSINTAGSGYTVGDYLSVGSGTEFYLEALDSLRVVNPGLSLTDFGGITAPTGGTGTGMVLDVTTLATILPTPANYSVGDVLIIRTPVFDTVAQAHVVIMAVDGSGVPTTMVITAKGAHNKNISGVYLTGTNGLGTELAVSITLTQENGTTLRDFLEPPDGTADATSKAKPGDTVKVLRDENFGNIAREYIYADYNGDGKYNFVPRAGTSGDHVYVGDGLFVEVSEDYIISLSTLTRQRITNAVQNTGDEVINGLKTFMTSPAVPAKTSDPDKLGATKLVTESQLYNFTEVIDGGVWVTP